MELLFAHAWDIHPPLHATYARSMKGEQCHNLKLFQGCYFFHYTINFSVVP